MILLAAWVAVLVYAFPGYMNFDVGEQLYQIRTGQVTDFHPPMMGGYWRIFEVFVSGPFPMLMLQTSLYIWGLYTLLSMRVAKPTAAWITAAFVVFPPLLTPMGMIWKDAQMSAFLMAGTALVLKRCRWARVLGMVLFIAAAGVRFNAPAALPFLTIAAAWGWTSRGRLVALGLAVALTLASILLAGAINKVLTDEPAYNWYRTTAIFDIVGTSCFAPPISDAEMLKLLDGIELVQKTNIQQEFCARYAPGERVNPPPWYSYSELFSWHPSKTDRLARKRAWKTLVTRYPIAYLQHRMTIASDMMGMFGARLWEPVGQDFAANEEHLRRVHHDHKLSWVQLHAGNACRWLAEHTPLYRAYLYALLGLVFFGWALWKRDLLITCIVGSGLLYQLSLAVGVNAPDFRYSHWMISCTCLGGALIAIKRWREARPGGEPEA